MWFFHIIKYNCDKSKILSGVKWSKHISGSWEQVMLCSLSLKVEQNKVGGISKKEEWCYKSEARERGSAIIQQTISFSMFLLQNFHNDNFLDVLSCVGLPMAPNCKWIDNQNLKFKYEISLLFIDNQRIQNPLSYLILSLPQSGRKVIMISSSFSPTVKTLLNSSG